MGEITATQESSEVAIADPGASSKADSARDRVEGPNLTLLRTRAARGSAKRITERDVVSVRSVGAGSGQRREFVRAEALTAARTRHGDGAHDRCEAFDLGEQAQALDRAER